MFNVRKYKILVYLNTENTINLNEKGLSKNPVYINYLQNKRIKILRNFLFTYSIFFQTLQFSPYIYKSELEFKLRQNPCYFFLLDCDYNEFFI